MTPEERQLLTTLAERVKNTPPQQRDMEADQALRQLVQERPDTVYVLAQTVLMQDFALRNAQAQIEDFQRQLSDGPQPSQQRSSGSFLGGMVPGMGGEPRLAGGSVPRVNPWGQPGQSYNDAPPPPNQGYPGYGGPQGPVMQPSQTSGFLRSAASTAAGVAGGALLFQGISSLFSGHHGGLLGGSGLTPQGSLTESTGVNRDAPLGSDQHHIADGGDRDSDGFQDADYDIGDDSDLGGGDYA